MASTDRVPARAWLVTFAGTAINLCLGILYAWSVWKASLIGTPDHLPGTPMTGLNEGWTYLTNAKATWAYALCGLIFALFMIPGGRLQDRFGPKLGAAAGAPQTAMTRTDWSAAEMLRTPQFYALVLLFVCTAQSGLLVIANAKSMLNETAALAGSLAFFAANAWLLSSFGGFVNAAGRVGSGLYSDSLGRANAYSL